MASRNVLALPQVILLCSQGGELLTFALVGLGDMRIPNADLWQSNETYAELTEVEELIFLKTSCFLDLLLAIQGKEIELNRVSKR